MIGNLKKDLNQIYFFYHIKLYGSFSIAAMKMGVSRSSLMLNIRDLEEYYQVRLINRNTRRFSLTREGEMLWEYARNIYLNLEKATESLNDSSRVNKGKITVHIPTVLDIPIMYNIFSEYMKIYPEVIIDTIFDDKRIDMIDEGVDLSFHIGDLPDSNYHARQLIHFDTYIVASKDYIEKNGIPQTPNDLINHQCVNFCHCKTGDKWKFKNPETHQYENYKLGNTIKVSSEKALLSFSEQGLGIGSALGFTCRDKIREGLLIPILTEWTYDVPLSLIFISKEFMPARLRNLIRLICDNISIASMYSRNS